MILASRRLQAGSERHDRRRSICAKAARGIFVCHRLHFRQTQAVGWYASVVEQARAKVQ
jgi:hypothetical protein